MLLFDITLVMVLEGMLLQDVVNVCIFVFFTLSSLEVRVHISSKPGLKINNFNGRRNLVKLKE